ncbi:MAG: TolC family protein [Verrucomicrobiae bacterium]|nr:TolC family protein [Verrucomicrobiae bacterium]
MNVFRSLSVVGFAGLMVVAAASCRKAAPPSPPAAPPPLPPAKIESPPPSAFDAPRPGTTETPPSAAESSAADEGPLDAVAPAASGEPLSFSEVLARVLTRYPELRARHAQVEEALAAQSLAVAGFLPRLQARVGWERTDSPVGVFMNKLEQRSFQQEDFQVDRLNHPSARSDFHGALRLEFPLFDAFQTLAASRTAGHALKSERARERHVRAEAALLAIEAWLQVERADRVEAMARESLARTRRDLAEAESLREQGLALGADFHTARVAAAALEQRLHECVATRAVARAALNILRGADLDRPFATPTVSVPVSADLRPTKEWLEDAFRNRADLAAARSAVEARRSEVGRMKARRLPDVSLFAEGADHTRAFEQHGSEYTLGAKATVDLFDPAHGARVRAAEARLKQVEETEAALRDAIATSIAGAAARVETARRNLAVLDAAAGDAREATRFTHGLARDGRKSVADILAARTVQLEVERARAEARAETVASRARLAFLAGRLESPLLDEFVLRLGAGENAAAEARTPKGAPK